VTNQAGTDELDAFNGLSQRSLPMALATSAFMLSLTGLPPMIGFIGKFSIFASAMSSGWLWLAVGGVLNSVISFYYYFGFVYRMFFKKGGEAQAPVAASPFLASCVCVTLLVTVLAGLFPQTLFLWVRQVVP
jgi:NADH-quinone oxidoreductase subunit N